jgi:2-(3-amino-3-carboxypropyl)histidine synthase
VPIDSTAIKTLYIFVEIAIDSAHLSQTIRLNIPAERKLFLQRLVESQEELDKVNAGQPIVAGIARLQLEGPSQIEKDSSGDLGDTSSRRTRLALVSTIQFVAAIQNLKENLGEQIPTDAASLESGKDQPNSISRANGTWTGTYEATIPRSKPLSPGEILGCTAPRLTDVDALLYVRQEL